jgi:carbon monoxide dehydrogenase subunit G
VKPVVVDSTIELPGPPDLVWRMLTDWERQGDWMLEASDFEVVSDHREGTGVTADATVKIGGISTRDRIRVDVWEPNTHLGIEHLGWVGGRGDLRLVDLGDGRTRLDWREELRPPMGFVGAIGMRLFVPLMARIFRRDARVLATLVEQAAAGRYPENER